MSFDMADGGNQAVMMLSLVFPRLQSFGINSRLACWKERAIYSLRSIVLETIGTIFCVTQKDIKTPHQITSGANEYTFGGWRGVQCEFNLTQVCRIVEKHYNHADAVFKSDHETQTFGEYIESAAKSSI
eukprot:14888743-Ditylum_brightwellii.AAC.1